MSEDLLEGVDISTIAKVGDGEGVTEAVGVDVGNIGTGTEAV